MDLADALTQSCNVYFFHAADVLGARPILDHASRFGFGRRTGVDLLDEQAGNLPDPAAGSWHAGDTRSLVIGQASLTATPLQVARLMAAVANGGYLVTPLVAKKAQPQLADEESAPALWQREPIARLSPATLVALRSALERVVSDPDGTAYSTVRSATIAIAGKTGTAQAGNGKPDHAWFAGYAPADNPRIAFAVVLEHAGAGSKAAGPVARQLVEAFVADGVLEADSAALRQASAKSPIR
jgi:penicillin-binding protein 2